MQGAGGVGGPVICLAQGGPICPGLQGSDIEARRCVRLGRDTEALFIQPAKADQRGGVVVFAGLGKPFGGGAVGLVDAASLKMEGAQLRLRLCNILRGGFAIPLDCGGVRGSHALSRCVEIAEIVLRPCIALLGGLRVPERRCFQRWRDTGSRGIEIAQLVLRAVIPLFRRLRVEGQRHGIGLRHAQAVFIHDGEAGPRNGIALIRGFCEPFKRQISCDLCAKAMQMRDAVAALTDGVALHGGVVIGGQRLLVAACGRQGLGQKGGHAGMIGKGVKRAQAGGQPLFCVDILKSDTGL